ncbi:dehydrogenase [Mangrovactinospora gilvigrisea]|uniref:Dehydrogenase n=1 Tax=Mangrovactinospora gilvigrisea TaxID=1428644 RepID=A0A1J7BAC0_9ACTN|nr:Gfo/Idh/MocA family oxidoreductase [Mangrovactinospora gilvigrisea]OIV35541.1 dehydrogenase [Mangrovactinospora gilvigrisea]
MTSEPANAKPPLRVGIAGYAFMGAVHSQAWRNAGRFFDLPVEPRLQVLCGRNRANAEAAAAKMGWAEVETDVERLIARDDIDVIDVCTPGDSHADIAIAALEAGKHVLCEKPLANTVAEAEAMVKAAEAARARGVRSMVAFNYRRVPALALARRMVADGRIGDIRHVRAVYLQDWITDPEAPLGWRLQKERAGSGALGDIGAHIIDATQYLTGQQISGVSALTETFVKERPLPADSGGAVSDLAGASAGAARGPVTVDDAALWTARFSGGAIGSFEATRFAAGRKNAMRVELNGSKGSLAFDFEAMNELWFHDHTEDAEYAGFRRILATEPGHPYAGAWWPPGHGLGYEHTFVHEIRDFATAIGEGTDPEPSFADGLRVGRVLAAVESSAANDSRFTPIAEAS